MPFDINGTFSRNFDFETDRINGIKIMSDRVDGEFDNYATAMNQTLLRTGEAPMGANLRMGSFRLTGLGDGSVANPSVTFTNDASSGMYRVGANQLGISIAGVKRVQFDATGVVANLTGDVLGGRVTAVGTGAPLIVNSTDSFVSKIIFQDAGVAVGRIGGSAAAPFYSLDSAGTILFSCTSGTFQLNTTLFNFGPSAGAASNVSEVINNTSSNSSLIFRSWSAGVSQDDAKIRSTRSGQVLTFTAGGTDIASMDSSAGLKVNSASKFALGDNIIRRNDGTAGITFSGSSIVFDTTAGAASGVSVDTSTNTVLADMLKSASNRTFPSLSAGVFGLCSVTGDGAVLGGFGTSYDASLYNRNGAWVFGVGPNKFQADYKGQLGAASTNTGEIGWRDLVPQSKSATYSLVLNDRGSLIPITTGGITIPDNSSVAFPVGSLVTVYNDSASSQTISMLGTDTLRLAGSASTGSRTLGQRGLANLLKVKTTEWVCSGTGAT